MPIFNIQSLEEKAKSKKIEIENKKNSIVENKHSISSENIFVSTIREMDDISNSINANIAYKESIKDDNTPNTNSSLFKDMILNFMNIFTSINTNLKEKCLSIKPSIDILKERLDNIEDSEDKVLKFNINYISNLDYQTANIVIKKLISDQLGLLDKDVDYFDDIKHFRSYIRSIFLGLDNEDPLTKQEYIQRLYYLFRDDSQGHITITKTDIENRIDALYKLQILFDHDISQIYNYLQDIYRSSDNQVNDIITKRISVILEEIALLESARADAIVECMEHTRQCISLYVQIYGGEDYE